MMLDWLDRKDAAAIVYAAVDRVFSDPANRTCDLGGSMGTVELGSRTAQAIAG